MTTVAYRIASGLLLGILLACCIAGWSQAATDPSPSFELTPPLDVSVSGDPDVIRNLSAGDFVVTLGRKLTPVVSAEARCQPTEGGRPRSSTQFFIYFDQDRMSLDGRNRAIQIAMSLVPKLVAAGEVAIVANGQRLRLLAPPTSDGEMLLRVVEQFGQDENRLEVRSWFESYPTGRLSAMLSAFSMPGPPRVVL